MKISISVGVQEYIRYASECYGICQNYEFYNVYVYLNLKEKTMAHETRSLYLVNSKGNIRNCEENYAQPNCISLLREL